MYTPTSERLVQVRSFDVLIAATAALLGNVAVRQMVGDKANELLDLAENAFMADIRGGLVSIPYSKWDSNYPAVVPEMDAPLYADRSVLFPTPRMAERVTAFIVNDGGTEAQAAAFIGGLPECRETPELLIPPSEGGGVTYHWYTSNQHWDIEVRSRPLVCAYANLGEYSPEEKGLVMAHELVHAADSQASLNVTEDTMAVLSETELRAYHTEVRLREALRTLGWSPRMLQLETDAYEVEAIRVLHNTPDVPYATSPQLIQDLMALEGVFDESHASSTAVA